MKTKNIIVNALFLMLVGSQTMLAQKMVVTLTNNQVVKYDVSEVKEVTFEKPIEHEWVDLGLPSGTLWATMNVGAENPEDYGDYFAWAETTGYKGNKTEFDWLTYKYCNNGDMGLLTKYCTDGTFGKVDYKKEIEATDDAATVYWGSSWQIPSLEQIQELISAQNVKVTKTALNGVVGIKIASLTNNNSIFLPAAGCRETRTVDFGSYGAYWSRSLAVNNNPYAYIMEFWTTSASPSTGTVDSARCIGRCIRPVRKK